MSVDIEPRPDELVFLEETFGGLKTDELSIPYEETEEWEIQVDVAGTVGLDELVTRDEDGTVRLTLSALPTSEVELRAVEPPSPESGQRTLDSREAGDAFATSRREEMPPIPDPTPLETDDDMAHYERLRENPNSQPAGYRRLLRDAEEISRPRFDRLCRRHGYDPEGGSHNASLLMLERLGEIERRGRGNDQVLRWVGE
ncbi:hypothetical protein BRC65_08005 [Halobacteriales archaeon QH_2_65_14]|nr:MAG: hypothetical protein BRC65_08005 [Halobacteriales archaeon QH_2_65_14]